MFGLDAGLMSGVPFVDVSSKSQKLNPFLAIGFGTTLFVAAVMVSPIGCSFLPAIKNDRIVMLREDVRTLLFSVRGNYRCLISIEGPFPEWDVGVGIKFRDRRSFLNFEKQQFFYPEDFVAEGDVLEGGTITLDKSTKQAIVDFDFTNSYYYNKPINGAYNLTRIELEGEE